MVIEEQYKELDSKLKSVIGTLEYLVTCNQREPGVTCYHAHSLNEPIQTLTDAKEILMGDAQIVPPNKEKPEVTVCKECKFAEREDSAAAFEETLTGFCLNEKAPVTEFVMGNRSCVKINNGDCQFFEFSDD